MPKPSVVMSFLVSQSGAGKDEIVVLEDDATGTKAEVYAFGALLNAFSIKQKGENKNVIYGFQNTEDAAKHITPLFQGAKLSPFVCRIKGGHYTFANNRYKIEKYYNQREAIHGLVFDTTFTVKESGATDTLAYVIFTCDYNKTDPGFPFFYRLTITYCLEANNTLTITTAVTNLCTSAMPVADGWHPYFNLGKKVDELQLFMNTTEIVDFDNCLLPTGHFTSYKNFIQPRLIEETRFDHCFVLAENSQQPACSLINLEEKLQVNIYAKKKYPFLQIFIPGNRAAIAIENLSSLPDAFNNGVGLIILEPSQSVEFVNAYQVCHLT